MELCNETIIAKTESLDSDGFDVYTDVVIQGVSWFRENLHNVTADGLKSADRVIVRIPANNFPAIDIVPGMQIVHGSETVKVLSWTDNRNRPHAPHVKIICA